MNKEIKATAALLDEKEQRREQIIAKAEKELTEITAKLTALRAQLETAEDAEQYKKIVIEIRDNEAVKEFCEKRAKEAKRDTLTDAEYKTITGAAKAAFDTIKAEHAKAINAEIDKLNKLFSAYDAEAAELNYILTRAAALKGDNARVILSAKTIGQNLGINHFYTDAFYQTKNAKELLKKGISV